MKNEIVSQTLHSIHYWREHITSPSPFHNLSGGGWLSLSGPWKPFDSDIEGYWRRGGTYD